MEPPYSIKYLNTLDRLALVKLCKKHKIIHKGASDALKLRLADLGKLAVRGKASGRQAASTASKGSSTRASSTRIKTRNARAVEGHDPTHPLPSTDCERAQPDAAPLSLVRNKPQLCARTPSSKVARIAATSPISTAKRPVRASSATHDTESLSTAGSQRRRRSVAPVVRSDSEATGASSVSSPGGGEQRIFDEIEQDSLNTIEDVQSLNQPPSPPEVTHIPPVARSLNSGPPLRALDSPLLTGRCDDAHRADVISGQIVGSCALGYMQPPLSFCRGEIDVPQASQTDLEQDSISTPDDSPVPADTQMEDDSVEPESEDDDDMELIIGHPRAVTPTLTYMVDAPPAPPPPPPARPPSKPDTPVFSYTLRTRASYRPLVRLPRKYPLAQLPKYRRFEGDSYDVRVYCLARNEKGVRGEQELSLDHAPWLVPPHARKRGKRRKTSS